MSTADNNPLRISCQKCGSHEIGFDIINQSYACKYCGQKDTPKKLRKSGQI